MDFRRGVGARVGGSRLKKMRYSPDACEKLKLIRQYVRQEFGIDIAKEILI